ncbi:hypothetical protein B0A55_11538 [Friedmanniomyces simplex]|uniref:Uncharacterized protein n=1 Tax=Friedmanniomyces simplex TaxID=329884 RepID=A0A4U0WR39_9PEZI|nr:hypothetical protein B0A55_11538 [Friedmanniomyces simplex]
MSTPLRSQLSRTHTWPPSTPRLTTDAPVAYKSEAGPMSTSTSTNSPPTTKEYLDEDLEDHPEDHFLSPIYSHSDWPSDSDDDEEETDWDAGITDFALFDTDRRRAQETHEQLDRRWAAFLSTQHSALQRAAQRNRAETEPETTRPPLPFEDLPGLTPDTSPSLRDDLEVEAVAEGPETRVPGYLTVTLTPPSPEERRVDENDELPLFFFFFDDDDNDDDAKNKAKRRGSAPPPRPFKAQRPGLRHARTLSGKAHSWRRPGWGLRVIGEEPDEEARAERGMGK